MMAPRTRTAEHRPALRRRKYRHDEYTCVDLFAGFGGLTLGIILAGFTAISAANHNAYKVSIHEANHPEVEHFVADLANPEASDYHSVTELPAADLLVAGVTCTNHSQANTQRAYREGLSLFDLDDPEWANAATRSERDRATATCVLQYAGKHHPRLILIECTTELQSWGYAVPGKRKIGDGTTFKWWLAEFGKLGYRHKILYLNSMFFGVPQSRDRLYICFWDAALPTPDLEHRPIAWCHGCDTTVEAVWRWKTGIPPTGQVRFGVQYVYRCPSCHRVVTPAYTPSLAALDLTNLGVRIGDRDKPLAPATMARAERCRQRFADFPAVIVPAKAAHGTEKHLLQPLPTQTAQQEAALLATGMVIPAHRHNGDGQPIHAPMDTVTSTHEKALLATAAIMQTANGYEHPGSECRTRDVTQPLWAQLATPSVALLSPGVALAIDNYQGAPRGAQDPLPTQGGSETFGLVTARVMPNRTNATSRGLDEPMETLVGGAGSGGLGIVSSGVVPFRRNSVAAMASEPMPTQTAGNVPGLLTAAGLIQQNEGVDRRVFGLDELLRTIVGNGNHFGLLAGGFIKNNGGIDEAGYRAHPLSDPLGAITSDTTQATLFSGWYKSNGSRGDETAPHPLTDPLNTLTAHDTTTLLNAEWRAALADLTLDDCYFRMLGPHEVGRGCGFDPDFNDHKGTFIVWGSARDQVDGYGNAVSPQVGTWIGLRLRAALHGEPVAACPT